MHPTTDSARINLTYLIRLRWGALLGQALLVLWMGQQVALPTDILLELIGAGLFSNALVWSWQRQSKQNPSDRPAALLMLMDGLLLTCVLALSGGSANPFSTLYLINVALGAVLLSGCWPWVLLVFSLVAFGALFPLQALGHWGGVPLPTHGDMMRLHLQGMWVAFALAAGSIVYFVQRVSRALAANEAELKRAKDLRHREEKVASLATLAAGAAHELSTPLSTIALVVAEAEASLRSGNSPERAAEDLRLAREQIERCRVILRQMSAAAGQSMGEDVRAVALEGICRDALASIPGMEAVQIAGNLQAKVIAPPLALSSAVAGLLRNALQASVATAGPPDIRIRVFEDTCRVWMEISDRGSGMSPAVLVRAGEPFFTTKPPGEGSGLGLFLTRTLLEQLGGEVHFWSKEGEGTRVRVGLPIPRTKHERRCPDGSSG